MTPGIERIPTAARATVADVVAVLRGELDDDLLGVTVHGSIALGGYRPGASDIDVLVVAGQPLGPATRDRLGRGLTEVSARALPGGVELSIVTAHALRHDQHPFPFELHVAPGWHEAWRTGTVDLTENRRDPDLAAHLTVSLARGITVAGAPLSTFIAAVPWDAYLDAIVWDAREAADRIIEHPVYGVLNLCRVLAAIVDGLVLSKRDGGAWGLDRLPGHPAVIRQALDVYAGARPDAGWDHSALTRFADEMTRRIDDACLTREQVD